MSLLDLHEESSGGYYWAAGIAGVLVLAAVGYFVHGKLTRPPENNKMSLCQADGPLGHVVVLVDKSDPMTFTQ